MYSYSSSSMSLFGNSRRNSPIRRYENRSPVARPAPECVTPKRSTKATTTTTTTTTPPPIERECRSPFVTPNHPLYMFGDGDSNNNEVDDFEVEPSRPQKVKNCLDSMNELSLSSPREEAPSPFRRLQLSRTFDDANEEDDDEEFHATHYYETPRDSRVLRHQTQTQTPPRVQHRVIRKSSAFGMEQMREMSIDSNLSLEQKLSVIEVDLEGEDGLATRLRRMKRRLFLENVASSPQQQQQQQQESLEATPKHSNRLDDITMEGMEVVLEDHSEGDAPFTNSDSIDGLYLTFSSSSLSLQMDIEEDDEDDDESPAETSETADWLMMAPLKQLSGDSSVVTEATVACSTFGNDDTHWASLSSITEQE